MKIAIVGSGISGLSIAHLLKKNHDVIVFEKDSQPGGLIKCERINDCLFHKVGGHVFNSKNEKITSWFWSHFDKDRDFVTAKRKAKIFFNNKIIGYPIENYLYALPKEIVKDILDELLELHLNQKCSPFEFANFADFLKQNFGETLYKIYFSPYNQKIWKTDLTTVSMQWLEGKLPMPNLQEILQSNIIREEEDNMVHSKFFYPKENGSQFIVDTLRKEINIANNVLVDKIGKKNGKVTVLDQTFDSIIYCGDIRKFPGKNLLLEGGLDISSLEDLRSNGTSNLFCEVDDNDMSWMYIPENFTKAHRIIYTGNFSSSNNRGSHRKTCVVEFSGKVAYEDMVLEIDKLPGNLYPLASNYEPNSYVVQDHQTRTTINSAKTILKDHNIFLLGRFAEWEYYNMDKAIEAAFSLYDLEFKNKD